MAGREGYAVIGPDRLWQAEGFERLLEGGEGEFLRRRRQGLAGEQKPAREVGDRERIAIPPIAEHELAFVVGTPEGVRNGRPRELAARGDVPPPAPPMHQAVSIEHRMDGA